MVYGIPPSDDPSPSSRVGYDTSKLRLHFSKILAEDESVSECKANRVGPMGTNGDSRCCRLGIAPRVKMLKISAWLLHLKW